MGDVLLDTNIIIYLLKGDEKTRNLLAGKRIFISFFTEFELLSYKELSTEQLSLIDFFVEESVIVEYDEEVRKTARGIILKYHLKAADGIIAACAINKKLQIMTADKIFSKLK